jgi:hypothetical protein
MSDHLPTPKQLSTATSLLALRGWSLTVEHREGTQLYRVGRPGGGSHVVSSWHSVVGILSSLQGAR